MATTEELHAVIGSPVDSVPIRNLIAADSLVESTEEDLEEGVPLSSYLTNERLGYQIVHRNGCVVTVFLYAEPSEGFDAFASPLPGGLQRGADREQVLAQFGIPERSGESFTDTVLGLQGAWDRFEVGETKIHFQYTEPDHRIRLVTIMAALDAP